MILINILFSDIFALLIESNFCLGELYWKIKTLMQKINSNSFKNESWLLWMQILLHENIV